MKKKAFTFLSVITIVVLFFFASCGGGAPKDEDSKDTTIEEATTPAETEAAVEDSSVPEEYAPGKKIYDEKCVVCHQADAKGMTGAFPPLANSDYLLEDPIRGIEQTLNGSHEEMVVNGETYNAPMVPQVDTKEEALAVINYVLKYFNDSDVKLTMEDIKDVEIKSREE